MQIEVASQRILLLKDLLSGKQASDIGADAIGMFLPGGGIAVKAAKKYIETRPR